jgi:transcription initiation factor TFIIA large subunit
MGFGLSADTFYRKCVLKDGVLTVNGKEYVFTKATGEYEW